MATPELLRIPLNAIRENPVALRAVNRQDVNYLGLVDSVRNKGVLNPINVRLVSNVDGSPVYGLIDGLHRYTASVDAGLKDIPAQVLSMSDAETMEAQMIANVHKVETKPSEYSKQLQKILAANPVLTITQLANSLSKTGTWLSERLGLLNLAKPCQALVDEGKINLSNAYALAKLPEEEQPNFVDRAMSMTPQEFSPTALARKKEIENAKRQGRDPAAAGFVPVPHLQKLVDLKAEMENGQVGAALIKELTLTTAAEGFAMGVKWALHMDPKSIEVAREKDAERKKAADAQKVAAAAERTKQRATEAAEAAAKAQAAVA